jgi:exosortase/archaeosortase family protein
VGSFFLLIVVFFSMLTYTPIVERIDIAAGLAHGSAWLSWLLLRGLGLFLGYDVSRNGTILGTPGFEVDVSPACSGAVPSMIYLSAVLAYPASLRSKCIGAGMGLAVINGLNLIRVVALFLIGLYFAQLFHETHVYIAQALVIAVAVATWLYWAGRFANAPGS